MLGTLDTEFYQVKLEVKRCQTFDYVDIFLIFDYFIEIIRQLVRVFRYGI